jgi:uncharacterized protein (DUF2252 family)
MTTTVAAPHTLTPTTPRSAREQRMARGKAARSEVPRSSHAEVLIGLERIDPLMLLAEQDGTRVPELLPIRYGRMASSAFAYYRGAARPMASDLAHTPRSGMMVQACGDAHLSNFGLFASPERNLVFDINDFDETLPAPWEWDVKRLATSVEIAGRDRGFSTKERRRSVLATVKTYREAMRRFADMDPLQVWYSSGDVTKIRALTGGAVNHQQKKTVKAAMAKAQTKDNLGAMGRFASVDDGVARIVADPPLVVPISDLWGEGAEAEGTAEMLTQLVAAYRETLDPDRRLLLDRYRVADIARKVVGVGSVGTRSWMLLLVDDDLNPLFLQAKEAGPSVLEGLVAVSEYDNAGQRVVVGQRSMQAVSDIFLGWVRSPGYDGTSRDFYLRQLRDWKGSADIETMLPEGIATYGALCGWTLARAHARTGDPVALAAYLGGSQAFDVAVLEFAETYADQNERDHQALVAAIADGTITAQDGV